MKHDVAPRSDDPDLVSSVEDVGRELETAGLMDALPFSPYQLISVLMAGTTIVLDGLDNQLLGFAAPSMISEWGLKREALGVIFALGFVGMAFGTMFAGWLADRMGRRGALILGVAIFAVTTLLTGFADNVTQIAVLRTIGGLGLGGVPGTAAALIAEYTPTRLRSLTVTAGIVCASLGGIFGGALASVILPHLGWRWLFYIGGAAPLACAALIWWRLPESPRYLAGRPYRAGELQAMLRRMGHVAPAQLPSRPPGAAGSSFVPTRVLFGPTLRQDTLALSAALFVGLFMIYLMFNWAPTLLFSNGFPLASAANGLMSFNLGGVIGAVLASLAVMRFGSRQVLLLLAVAGMGVCAALSLLPIGGGRNAGLLYASLLVMGLTASAVQSAIYAVGAHAFPTSVRARGIGVMAAAGRIGAILSAFCGAVLTQGGSFAFFAVIAGLMLVNAVSLALVRGHIPRLSPRRPAPFPAPAA